MIPGRIILEGNIETNLNTNFTCHNNGRSIHQYQKISEINTLDPFCTLGPLNLINKNNKNNCSEIAKISPKFKASDQASINQSINSNPNIKNSINNSKFNKNNIIQGIISNDFNNYSFAETNHSEFLNNLNEFNYLNSSNITQLKEVDESNSSNNRLNQSKEWNKTFNNSEIDPEIQDENEHYKSAIKKSILLNHKQNSKCNSTNIYSNKEISKNINKIDNNSKELNDYKNVDPNSPKCILLSKNRNKNNIDEINQREHSKIKNKKNIHKTFFKIEDNRGFKNQPARNKSLKIENMTDLKKELENYNKGAHISKFENPKYSEKKYSSLRNRKNKE